MPADEMVDPREVIMGHPAVPLIAATIAPFEERALDDRTVEIRRIADSAHCYIQVGPMRYVVLADHLVAAVIKAFPFSSDQVRDSMKGKFEISATVDALDEAVRRAFHALVGYTNGLLPKRMTGPLDLLSIATGLPAAEIAEKLEAHGCEVVVDVMAASIVIDYGARGYPFSVTVHVVAEPS
jgi:hypothetical protein